MEVSFNYLFFFCNAKTIYECQNTTLAIYLSLYSINLYLRDNYSFILVLKVGLVAFKLYITSPTSLSIVDFTYYWRLLRYLIRSWIHDLISFDRLNNFTNTQDSKREWHTLQSRRSVFIIAYEYRAQLIYFT